MGPEYLRDFIIIFSIHTTLLWWPEAFYVSTIPWLIHSFCSNSLIILRSYETNSSLMKYVSRSFSSIMSFFRCLWFYLTICFFSQNSSLNLIIFLSRPVYSTKFSIVTFPVDWIINKIKALRGVQTTSKFWLLRFIYSSTCPIAKCKSNFNLFTFVCRKKSEKFWKAFYNCSF